MTQDQADIVGFAWMRDGTGFVVASNREGGERKLWQVPLGGAAPRALTDGSSSPTFPAISGQGFQINFTQFHVTAPIWRIEGGRQTKVLDNQSFNKAPAISPDGKWMIYTSDRAGKSKLWRSHADGSDSRPLLYGDSYETGAARWSPDGNRIVFECRKAGPTHICVSDEDGNDLRQLTSSASYDVLPSWSHDGDAIYFTSDVSGSEQIYRITLASGAVLPMTHHGGDRAIESWDGQWLYVSRGQPLGGMIALPVQRSAQDWRMAENAPFLPQVGANTSPNWDAYKDGFVYQALRDGNASPELRLFDMQSRKTKELAVLKELPPGTELTVSVLPDGRSVAYTGESSSSELDVMVAIKAPAGRETDPH